MQLLGPAGRLGFVAVVVVAPPCFGVGVSRGSFRETGGTGIRSTKLDLQNVPWSLRLKRAKSESPHLGNSCGVQLDTLGFCTFCVTRGFCRSEGVLAPGTAYVIPARVGVWLPGGSFLGSDVRLGFVVLSCFARARGPCFSRYVSGDGDHADAFS